MKDHAEFLTKKQIAAQIAEMKRMVQDGTIYDESNKRHAHFSDPANAAEIAEQRAKMDLIISLYEARKAAGLTQKQIAEKLGTTQANIAELERGRRNITFATLTKYARACGKRICVTLL